MDINNEYDISTYDENLKDYVNGLWIEINKFKSKITRRNKQIKGLKKEEQNLIQQLEEIELLINKNEYYNVADLESAIHNILGR